MHFQAIESRASNEFIDSLSFTIETKATFSGGANTPFWLVSNIFGLGIPELNNGYVRGKVEKPLSSSKRFSVGGAIDLVGGWNLPAAFKVQQLFAELKYRKIWISIGSREFQCEYNNRLLSSGDLLFSGNSMPIPQVRIGTFGFAPVWGTKDWFYIKAYLAYGLFTDGKWMKNWVEPGSIRNSNTLFCSRGLWFRIGNESKFPLKFDIGIEMGTQFGGIVYKDGVKIKMPTKLIDWVKAIIPSSGNSDTPWGEQVNVQGNMTGEYSMSLSYSPSPKWNLRVYYEHYFEDQSQMGFEYGPWKDGLWGLEVDFPKNRFLSKFVYEFVSTKDQTGPVLNNWTPEIPEQVSGRDGYYTHYLFGAWQNWGMTMGTPLAISPLYNKNHIMTLFNTRFIVNHLGLEGSPTEDLSYRFLLTFSRNWGTYYRPLKEIMNNYSGLVEVSYYPPQIKGWFAKAAIAWDKGVLLGNNFGGMISIGFQGYFTFNKK